MYEHHESQMVMPDEFFLPFGGKLNADNRWVKLAQLIPWEKAEEAYIQSLKDTSQGNKAYSIRKALGTLIIKERMNWSDEETVEQIKENPYLQYFIGLSSFQEKAPFDASLIIHFRKRLDVSIIHQVNEWIVEAQSQQTKDQRSEQDDDHDDGDSHGGEASDDTPASQSEDRAKSSSHQGKLLIDATCAPADITYPTDLGLLNDAREKLETMIDTLHLPH